MKIQNLESEENNNVSSTTGRQQLEGKPKSERDSPIT